MDKEEYYKWIESNDFYPEHSHQWIVGVYNKYKGVEAVHRYFGTFTNRNEAKIFASNYRDKFTKPGFITRVKIFPLCEVVDFDVDF